MPIILKNITKKKVLSEEISFSIKIISSVSGYYFKLYDGKRILDISELFYVYLTTIL